MSVGALWACGVLFLAYVVGMLVQHVTGSEQAGGYVAGFVLASSALFEMYRSGTGELA